MDNYIALRNNSRNLVSRIFDEWNKKGRAEFMRQYNLALNEARKEVQELFDKRYQI
jgi:hypothetical protein